jgi:hypothetical protein
MNLMKLISFILAQFVLLKIFASPSGTASQCDTVYVSEVISSPTFDGIGNDVCWESARWQTINKVWIPWGTTMEPNDFSGRYKVVWSSKENELFFLIEITDDIVSDAYVPGETAAIYNFDMFEVFIDENKSGGYHVFDGTANDEASLGLNAENAFAYHIFTRFPDSGGTSNNFRVEDIGGNNWGNIVTKIYNAHFPNFVLRKEGCINTWEFSLIVYNDTYSDENIETSRVILATNKVLGLSIAFNDDDEPEVNPIQTVRDNFIGSVAVTEAAYNDHWKNADDFGTLKLISGTINITDALSKPVIPILIFHNPAGTDFTVSQANN